MPHKEESHFLPYKTLDLHKIVEMVQSFHITKLRFPCINILH